MLIFDETSILESCLMIFLELPVFLYLSSFPASWLPLVFDARIWSSISLTPKTTNSPDSLSVCLLLSVPPIIEPFSFQDGLSEGMRTRTVCGVSAGDPPLAVTWLKDGRPLSPELGVNVTSLDPYSSLLSVSR